MNGGPTDIVDLDRLDRFIAGEDYVDHDPDRSDGLEPLGSVLDERLPSGRSVLDLALYDPFRVEDGKIVEHWDSIEAVAPRSEWKNDHGKF